MEYWSDGVVKYWSNGVMEWWSGGLPPAVIPKLQHAIAPVMHLWAA
jgi:hypothetical protein